MPLPQSILKALFGAVPAGTKNTLSVAAPAPTGGKANFPAGKGVIVKPAKPQPTGE